MLTVFQEVGILMLFAAIGYGLTRSGIVSAAHGGILSKLLVWVFLPCNIFNNFSRNCNLGYFSENYVILLYSVGILVALAVVMHFVAKLFSKDKYERSVFSYSLVVPVYGYVGYPLAEALLGSVGLTNFMLFALPVSFYAYSYGYATLTKSKFSPKKLFNPINIAMLLGVAIGLSGMEMPYVISSVLSKSASCVAPVSMLLTGIVISEFRLRDILRNPRIYAISALRLLVIPLAVCLAINGFAPDWVLKTAVLFLAIPCGLNTVVFPKSVGESCELGAGIALVSNVLACVTIPIVCAIVGI